MSTYQESLKLLVVGSSACGKTCFTMRYCNNDFSEDTPSTIGIEFFHKQVPIDGRNTKLLIWDTAGMERFRAVNRASYAGAKGIVLMYDITQQSSFDELPGWLSEIRSLVPANAPIMLVGNKCDLDHMRVVKKDVADAFARSQHLPLFETSARDGTNVERAMEHLVKQVHEHLMLAEQQNLNVPRKPIAMPGRLAPPGASVSLTGSGTNEPGKPGESGGAGPKPDESKCSC